MQTHESGHDPVLLREVLASLNVREGATIIDCTIGRGGHAAEIAAQLGSSGLLVGLDVDPKNLEYARGRLASAPCEVRLFHANFAELGEVMSQLGKTHVDGIVADLGVSTNQLFDSAYGLSFASDMPLDMRLDPRLSRSAADLVNSLREADLADVLYELAQERYSRRIARKITEARRLSPIKTTGALAELVRSAIPRAGPKGKREEKIDPATRSFMALRMAVNREIENLQGLLDQAPQLLKSGGRLAVISFHSSEDRLVKQAYRSAEQTGLLKILTKKPLTPSDSESAANPRSRSAKLRIAEKM